MKRATTPVRDAVIYLGNDFVSMPCNVDPIVSPTPDVDAPLAPQSAINTETSDSPQRDDLRLEPAHNSSADA
jgi:hypothetical protein